MTMAAPHCSCDSPIYLGNQCSVHGSRMARDRLVVAERARDAFREENGRLRRLLEEVLANYDPRSSEMWSIDMWLEDVANEVEG